MSTPIEIPERSVFRAPEVCEMADVQPYVLRTWEAEFADLGVAKTAGGPRLYRKPDVERVLRIKHLLFVDGLTLAGVRRRLMEEAPTPPEPEPIVEGEWVEAVDVALRERLRDVRGGLQSILSMLTNAPKVQARHAAANGNGRSAAKGKPAVKGGAKFKAVARPKPAKAKAAAKSKPKTAARPRPAAKAKSKPKRASGAKKR